MAACRLPAFFVNFLHGALPVIPVSPMRLPFLFPNLMGSLADSLLTVFQSKAPFIK
jgi:hypothetical protein